MTYKKVNSAEAYIAKVGEMVENGLEKFLVAEGDNPTQLAEAMRYSLLGGGKRIRPVLLFAAHESVNGNFANALPVACAIEMIHSYSLIHDDLPAMDNDDLRRGKPTNHRVFGEATAILAGDTLLTTAFSLLSNKKLYQKIDDSLLLEIISIIATASGINGMAGGQMLDILAERSAIEEENLLIEIHKKKTACLIAASLKVGALLGGASEKQTAALEKYGMEIGFAFQVADDLLDVEGSVDLLGKEIGSDVQRGKLTYPALYGVEKSRSHLHSLIESALETISFFDEKATPLRLIAHYIGYRER
ncbi:MAG: polyprenyl synthetase family protein [Deltaproteobacteria bacterium]|nr:polyprenyl synthetase family protein [Deltaproteobacteria bacterium]